MCQGLHAKTLMALLAGGNNLGIIPPNCMVALASTFPENWILYFKKKFLLYGEKLRLCLRATRENRKLSVDSCSGTLGLSRKTRDFEGYWRKRWPASGDPLTTTPTSTQRGFTTGATCSNQTLRKRFDRSLEDPLNSYVIFFPHVLTILVLLLLLFFNEENNIVKTASTLSTYQECLFMQMMNSLKRSLSFPKFIQHLLRNVG